MIAEFDRRLMLRTMAALPVAVLPFTTLAGCATGMGGISLTEAIQRLLTLSSQRAFALLLAPGGFYDHAVARIELPPQFASNGTLLQRILSAGVVRDRLLRTLNDAAEVGARRAAPVVTQAISTLSVADALAVVRGGPTAATALLEQSMNNGLIEVMFPEIGGALRLAANPEVARAVGAVTGYDVAALTRDVTRAANRSIWAAIGQEEAAIRANPQATGDPLLIGLFTLAR